MVWHTVIPVLMLSCAGHALALCEEQSPQGIYRREHEVHNFNGNEPFTATDKLDIWKATDGTQCFSLLTIGPNGHECDVSGPLKAADNHTLEFEDRACKLTFILLENAVVLKVSPGWERLGVCPRQFRCGMHGVVEPGIYK
jgi:hypothetical protein